jgi:hypothetical protein
MDEPCIEHGKHEREDYCTISVQGFQVKLHRLICAQKYGIDLWDESWIACHTCDNRRCINHNHIYPGDKSTNGHDAYRNLKSLKGEARTTARLSNAAVEAIKIDTRPQTVIAAEYGVSQSLVSRIKNGERRV